MSDDGDLWEPPKLLETDKVYPTTRCHSTLTFMHFCNLAEVSPRFENQILASLLLTIYRQIINESYNTVYSGTARNINTNAIFDLEKKLNAFHQQLPDSLRIENAAGLQSCVPPHILCLK